MTDVPSANELFRLYSSRAKKRFGQHFLTDPNLLERIADVAAVSEGDRVLEVGPGCGPLTATLLRRGANVTAVELDRDAAAFLREQLGDHPRFELIEHDALSLDYDEVLGSHRWKSVSNLPYNIGTQIMFDLLEHPSSFESLALMFQKEVANRITGSTGTKAYGSLTVEVARRAKASVAMKLKPGAFTPPPKVDSAVVLLEPWAEPPITDEAFGDFFSRVVTAAFAMRRKTVRNALKAKFETSEVDAALSAAGIEPRTRAERIEFDRFLALARAFPKHHHEAE